MWHLVSVLMMSAKKMKKNDKVSLNKNIALCFLYYVKSIYSSLVKIKVYL